MMSRRANRRVSFTECTGDDSNAVDDHHEAKNGRDVPVFGKIESENISTHGGIGVFKRLRKRFSSISRGSPTGTTSVRAANLAPVEERRNGIIIVPKKRMLRYQYVPLPPGSIPSEVMLIAANQNQPVVPVASQDVAEYEEQQRPAEIKGTVRVKEENQRQTETLSENTPRRRYNGLPDILYNNWVDPNF